MTPSISADLIVSQAKALWQYYDDSASPKFIQQRQVMHVSILSFGNFIGRLSSGMSAHSLFTIGY